jgi:hypothetical protein
MSHVDVEKKKKKLIFFELLVPIYIVGYLYCMNKKKLIFE